MAIRPAHVETAFVENDLDFPDLIRAQIQRRSSAAAETCAAARANRHDRDDLPAVVDDHDVIAHDEVLMPAPSRIDLDQRRRHVNEAHARRHHGPDAQRKVDIVHARHVAAGENGLPNCRALLRVEGHVASLSLALLRLTLLRLTLLRGLRLALLWGLGALTLLRSLALLPLRCLAGGLTLLTRLRLALLALLILRSLTCGLVPLLLTLAALLGLPLLALVAALLLRLVWLGLLLLASLTSRLLALLLRLATLRLTLHLLVLALLRLLLVLARLRLPSRLLLLGLPALLGLPLLALSTLRLAGAALLVACSCGAAFGLRAALGTGLAG